VDATIRNLYDIIASSPFSSHLQVYGGVYSDPNTNSVIGLPGRNNHAAGSSTAGSVTDRQFNNHSAGQNSKQNAGISRQEGMNEPGPVRDSHSNRGGSSQQPSQRAVGSRGSTGHTTTATTATTASTAAAERSTGHRTSWADRTRESNVNTETDTPRRTANKKRLRIIHKDRKAFIRHRAPG